jgi:hypothetical protein
MQAPTPKRGSIIYNFLNKDSLQNRVCQNRYCNKKCFLNELYCNECIPIYLSEKYIYTPKPIKMKNNKIVFIGYRLIKRYENI